MHTTTHRPALPDIERVTAEIREARRTPRARYEAVVLVLEFCEAWHVFNLRSPITPGGRITEVPAPRL